MPYQDVMNVMLPNQGGHSAHITGHYGEHRAKGPHGGSDFNYEGGQAGSNLTHPSIHSPIGGEVTFVGGNYGTIKIRDADGNSHEILHTQSQSVKVGQHVKVGDEIGHMGGRGPDGATQYAQHVHYQMKDAQGHPVNPETFWRDRQVGTPGAQAHGSHASAAPSTSHAAQGNHAHGDTLRKGDEGTRVTALQEQLSRLGYKDENGHALKPDGHFGDHTKHALKNFQRDRGLDHDGIAGNKTMEALTKQVHAAPGLDSPANPYHPMFKQAEAGVHKLDAEHQRTPDHQSSQFAGSLTAGAVQQGLTRIDHVALNGDASKAYAVQGELNSPFKQIAEVNTQQAMSTPLEKSSEAVQQHAVQQGHAEQAQAQQAQQAQQNQQLAQHQEQQQTVQRQAMQPPGS
jgi:putative chitinase